jgi:putative methionine-R-sulfoxide reductase with GAF domain
VRTQAYRGALEAVERVLNRGGDADDVLRDVVRILRERAGYAWAAVAFVEAGELQLGPEEGERADGARAVPVSFRGDRIAELSVAPAAGDEEERAFLERVATIVSPYCLVGWDTGGEAWDP